MTPEPLPLDNPLMKMDNVGKYPLRNTSIYIVVLVFSKGFMIMPHNEMTIIIII